MVMWCVIYVTTRSLRLADLTCRYSHIHSTPSSRQPAIHPSRGHPSIGLRRYFKVATALPPYKTSHSRMGIPSSIFSFSISIHHIILSEARRSDKVSHVLPSTNPFELLSITYHFPIAKHSKTEMISFITVIPFLLIQPFATISFPFAKDFDVGWELWAKPVDSGWAEC